MLTEYGVFFDFKQDKWHFRLQVGSVFCNFTTSYFKPENQI